MEILSDFGVNWSSLIISIVNFAVLAVILWFVMIKPILKLLTEREEKIRTSLERADLARQEADTIEKELVQKKDNAVNQAKEIISDAKKQAEKITVENVKSAEKKASEIIEKAHLQSKADREVLMKGATLQLADIVADATKLVITEVVTEKVDSEIIEKTLKQVTSSR